MKFNILLAAFLFGGLAQAAQMQPGTYAIDPMHSKIGFEVAHLVISTVEGKFDKFDGKIVIDKDIAKSKAEINIETASVDTGVQKRDDHLKSPDFFDAAKFPKMTFKTKTVVAEGDALNITGDLTIKGVTKPVTFKAAYLGNVKDGFGQEKAAFKGKTKINRKEFGLSWNNMVEKGPVVGDEVEVSMNIQATKGK